VAGAAQADAHTDSDAVVHARLSSARRQFSGTAPATETKHWRGQSLIRECVFLLVLCSAAMDASADTILSKAKGLNLFEESVTDENPEVVRQGRIKTWIFLVLLPAGFIGYIIWALTSKQIIVVSAEPASYAQFRELSAAHPDLSCTCTQLSMPLARILPPLPEQPLTVTAKVVGQMDVGNRRINFTEADSTNWIAAGFTMYDKWCSRVILEELNNPSGPVRATNDQLGSYCALRAGTREGAQVMISLLPVVCEYVIRMRCGEHQSSSQRLASVIISHLFRVSMCRGNPLSAK